MAMESNPFEQAFADFIDRREYDEAQSALFDLVRYALKFKFQQNIKKTS